MSLFTLKNVSYNYGSTKVLSHIDLQIEEGELTIITGANGIGKTTLLHLLAGIIDPTEGKIIKQAHKKIAFVSQK